MTATAPPQAHPLAPSATDVRPSADSPRLKPQRDDAPSKRSRRRFDDIF